MSTSTVHQIATGLESDLPSLASAIEYAETVGHFNPDYQRVAEVLREKRRNLDSTVEHAERWDAQN